MSKQPVETEMRRFLNSDTPEAICISGTWGVGKTYLWNEIVLPDEKKHERIQLKRYSYVSLFGINSLDQLKQAIFENSKHVDDIGSSFSIKHFEKYIRKMSSPMARILGAMPASSGAASQASIWLSMSTSKQIICLDDLERKGDSLSMRDVFGLVSFLREERECKIIVLANHSDLTGCDQEQYEQYLEKVFDRVLIFCPTVEYCADIIQASSSLRTKLSQLNVSNIRVAKKIQTFIEKVRPHLKPFNPLVMSQAEHTLVLLGWIKFNKGGPSLKFLSERYSLSNMEASLEEPLGLLENEDIEDKEVPDDVREKIGWNTIINAYGFGELDRMDGVLANLVENGYLDTTLLIEAASELDQDARITEARELRRAVWRDIDETFSDDEGETLAALIEAYSSTMAHVGLASLNRAVSLLRFVEHDIDADKLIDLYFSVHDGNPKAFDVKRHSEFGERIEDEKLLSKINSISKPSKEADSPIDAILRIEREGIATSYDYKLASQASAKMLAAHFKTLDKDDFKIFARACFASKNARQKYGRDDPVSQAATEALVLIGSESLLNAYRVSRLGIDFVTLNNKAAKGTLE